MSTKIKYLFAIIRLPGYGQVFFVYPLGVVNVLSNIEIFFFEPNCSSLETSGSTNLNQATLTTPKHAKLT